jgi:NTP pyrophosphatase (non-canonical NTP hydrolase)
MNLEELKNMQIEQMTKKNCLPKNELEVVLHMVEEVGEVCEAIREKQSKEDFENEVADILWQLNKLCWIHKIDLEKVFLSKLKKNEKR